MTYAEFMTTLTEYYGDYNSKVTKKMVLKFVMRIFEEKDLEQTFFCITRKLSNKYKSPPDIEFFERYFVEPESNKIESQALIAWNEVNKQINSMADVVFENIILQAVIEGMGGWINFCQRPNDHKSEVFSQKRFIELYKLYSTERPLIEPKVLRGMSNSIKRPIVKIGNVTKCDLILKDTQKTLSGNEANLINLVKKSYKRISLIKE